MAKSTFLDYYKTILEKVSFDGRLVAKEYRKAKELLHEEDCQELDNWVRSTGLARHLLQGMPQGHHRTKPNQMPTQPIAQSMASPKAKF